MKNKIKFIHDNMIKTGYTKTNLTRNTKQFIIIEKGKNKYKIDKENILINDNIKEFRKKLLRHQVKNYASNYNLKIIWLNNTLKITSILDEWFIEPKKGFYILQHMNKFTQNTTGRFHKQGVFYSYFSALRHIAEHDKNKLGEFVIDNLL